MNHNEPKNNNCLISYGIICFKKFEDGKYKIVLVRRKNTIGYVEFLRGKYDINDEKYLLKLFNIMTIQEKFDILKYRDFNVLRNLLGMTKKNNIYKTEYDRAERKFNILKQELSDNQNTKVSFNLDTLVSKSNTKWNETEWGVPKGRKQQKEMDLNCGIREFTEETNIKLKDIKIIFNLKPLIEEYVSINGIKYRHIYYFANHINKRCDLRINPFNLDQVNEINAISWLDKDESHSLIREYYIEKKNIIKQAFNILEKLDEFIYLH